MNVIRIDTNALKWLIESQGDEFKLELTKSVLAESARMVVKGIVPKETAEIYDTAIRAEIAEQIGEVRGSWQRKTVTLNSDVEKAIRDIVRAGAGDAVSEAYRQFQEYVDKKVEEYMYYVSTAIDKKFDGVLETRIQQEVERRVQEILARAVSEVGT